MQTLSNPSFKGEHACILTYMYISHTIHAYIEKQNLFVHQAHETLYVKAQQLD